MLSANGVPVMACIGAVHISAPLSAMAMMSVTSSIMGCVYVSVRSKWVYLRGCCWRRSWSCSSAVSGIFQDVSFCGLG